MIDWLKKHFVPHEGNGHRPHFLRRENMRSVLGILIFVELLAFVIPTLNFNFVATNSNLVAVLPAVLGTLTNDERANNNLPELKSNPLLDESAKLKAEDMAAKGYFAHTSPEGRTPWYWLDLVGYKYEYAGENLAINFTDSKDVTDAWMNSPTHRANIVKGEYTEFGTGIATGMYQGHETIFVVQVYANPRQVKAPAAVAVASAVPKEPSKPASSTTTSNAKEPEEVLGVSTVQAPAQTPTLAVNSQSVPVKDPSLIEKIVSSPRHSTNAVFAVILTLVLIALLMTVLINMNFIHADLITNGLLVAVVIGGIFIANSYLGTKNLVIGESLDYSAAHTAASLN